MGNDPHKLQQSVGWIFISWFCNGMTERGDKAILNALFTKNEQNDGNVSGAEVVVDVVVVVVVVAVVVVVVVVLEENVGKDVVVVLKGKNVGKWVVFFWTTPEKPNYLLKYLISYI